MSRVASLTDQCAGRWTLCQIPYADGLIFTPCDQCLAVGTERQPVHYKCVASEGLADELLSPDIPQPDRFVVAARGQCLAIWAKGQTADSPRMPLKDSQLSPALYTPQPDRLVPTARSQGFAVRAKGQAGHEFTMAR